MVSQHSNNLANEGLSPQPRARDASDGDAHILIVEDHRDLRESMRTFLEVYGHEVSTAANYGQAIDAASRHPPDVVICDWHLNAKQDGADVARTLQQSFDVKIIFVSASSIRALREKTPDLEVFKYLRKPALLADIERVVCAARNQP